MLYDRYRGGERAAVTESPALKKVEVRIPSLTAPTFDAAINAATPTLVEFYADWCGPCRSMIAVLESFADDAQGRYAVYRVSAEEEPALAKAYDVRGVPTFLAFSEGRLIGRHGGTASAQKLRQILGLE